MRKLYRATTSSLSILATVLVPACTGEDPGATTASGSAGDSGGATTNSTGSGHGGADATPCGTCGEHASCGENGACMCDKGWRGDGQTCDDIDECSEELDTCHDSAACSNTEGSFSCTCPPGTVGDPLTGCEARYVDVAAGGYHTCARRQDNALFCFGYGGNGRLGNGLLSNQAAPVRAGAASNWKRLAMGASHSCGIKENGTLWCWGANGSGQLGLGHTDGQTLPAYISLDQTWTSVAAGSSHSCAVGTDGTLSCWGANSAGQLGTGSPSNENKTVPVHVSLNSAAVEPDSDWKEVFAGLDTTCAIKQSGKLYCWGLNKDLQVSKTGNETVTTPYLVETTPMAADTDWASAAVGVTTCALKVDGSLFCWGRGAEGGLGNGDMKGSATPVPVSHKEKKKWERARVGWNHVCAIDEAGALFCWGRNQAAQVKAGSSGGVGKPLEIGEDWVDVSLGASHSCGVKKDGRVLCWGTRVYGQLGDGTMSLPTTPAQIGAETTWTAVWSFGEAGCALGPGNAAWCWGNNDIGQLGLGDTASRAAPAAVASMDAFSRIAPGRQHACALTLAGAIVCTGRNPDGQLGRGADKNSSMTFGSIVSDGTPYAGFTWKALAAGEQHACAIALDGSLWCWGYNNHGQLGHSMVPSSGTLTQVLPMEAKNWKAVAAGQYHTCATRSDSSLYCWGRNVEGQVGNGMPAGGTTAPFNVGTGFRDTLAAGVNHSCALKLDGSLWCWGLNTSGQLGDNSTTARPSPVQVGSNTDWTQVSAGNSSTCARKTTGTLWCWGSSSIGQLGVGDFAQRKVPTQVGSGANWADVSMGYGHACGRQSDGTLWCWGSGEFGQNARGDGFAAGPVPVAEAKK